MYAFFVSDAHGDAVKAIIKMLAIVIGIFWAAFFSAFAYICAEKKFIYPLTYRTEIVEASEKYGLETELLFGIVRTESGFNANAVSVKGAIGLMQITPLTGKFIAQKTKTSDYDLFDVKTNLEFGCYYWNYLSAKFFGLRETAAAYNAGEGTVKGWLKDTRYSSDGKTLDKIPYPETAAYVKKIYESLKRYKKLYGNLLDKRQNFR